MLKLSDFGFRVHDVRDDMVFMPDRAGVKPGSIDSTTSMTRGDMADDCDINKLMERYGWDNLTHINKANPIYLDWTELPDLQGSMEVYNQVRESFMSLPASVRKDFENEPEKFLAFAQDEKNVDKMREYGMLPPVKAEPAPQRVEIVNPPAPIPVDKEGGKG